MARIESSMTVKASPGAVRARADDLASAAEFTDGALSLVLLDAVAVSGAKIKGTLTLDDMDMPFSAEITEAGIERLVWETTESRVPMRWELTAKAIPEGSRVVASLETGTIGGVPGSRAEQSAIRALQDMTENYVVALRSAVQEGITVDLGAEDRVTA